MLVSLGLDGTERQLEGRERFVRLRPSRESSSPSFSPAPVERRVTALACSREESSRL